MDKPSSTMTRPAKIALLIPTKNEIEGMRAIMPRIQTSWVDEIIVIDHGSTDGTPEYAQSQGCTVIQQESKWLSGAYADALKYITSDIIITFSPDGNSIPEHIPTLINKINEGYDMVIVSRYLDNATSSDDDFLTSFGNWFFTKLINLLFNAKYTDSLVIFRAWRKEIFQYCNGAVPYLLIDPYISIQCAKRKVSIAEIPGDEPKRIGGIRKMEPLRNGLMLLRIIINEYFRNQPIQPSTRSGNP